VESTHAPADPVRTPRLSASAWSLVGQAIGGPRQWAGKVVRLARTLRIWLDRREVERRLESLRRQGLIEACPPRRALFFGGLDMLRFMIEPAARDYYRQKGIGFGFHQLLRILDDPVSMIDPTGFMSDRDTIVGHVMQVVHLNPVYDLQLVQMFDDGLEDLERQVQDMVEGSHPRARSIGAIVEEPGYHERLLEFVRAYRRDPASAPPIRKVESLRGDPHFDAAERTFHTLPGFIAYCDALPRRWGDLLRRWRRLERFPIDWDAGRVQPSGESRSTRGTPVSICQAGELELDAQTRPSESKSSSRV